MGRKLVDVVKVRYLGRHVKPTFYVRIPKVLAKELSLRVGEKFALYWSKDELIYRRLK